MKPNPQAASKLAKAVRDSLESLKRRRPIFHSEGDFQSELIRTMTDGGIFSRVRKEQKFPNVLVGEHLGEGGVDIVADGVALELKEKSRACKINLGGKPFDLKGASRFSSNNKKDSRRDIRRIIELVRNKDAGVQVGFVVILTSRSFPNAKEQLLGEGLGVDLPDNCAVQFEEGV